MVAVGAQPLDCAGGAAQRPHLLDDFAGPDLALPVFQVNYHGQSRHRYPAFQRLILFRHGYEVRNAFRRLCPRALRPNGADPDCQPKTQLHVRCLLFCLIENGHLPNIHSTGRPSGPLAVIGSSKCIKSLVGASAANGAREGVKSSV